MIGVLSARKVMNVTGVAKAALAVNNGIADSGGSSRDMFVADLDEKADGNPSAMASLNKGFAETGNKNASKEAAAHSVPVE